MDLDSTSGVAGMAAGLVGTSLMAEVVVGGGSAFAVAAALFCLCSRLGV